MSNAVAIFESVNAVEVLQHPAKFDKFYDDIKRETDAHETDLTTERGRKAVASLAYKVARTKTAIDDAGKLLTEEWRGKISVVDKARREIRERLDGLRDEVRAPLTKWEADEEARLKVVDERFEWLRSAAVVTLDMDSVTVLGRAEFVSSSVFPEDIFQASREIALNLQAQTVATLRAAGERLLREEADRVELEKLRSAQAQREAMEIAEREAREEAEREVARIEAEGAAERARVAAVAKQAEERKAEISRVAAEAEASARAQAERQAEEAREHAEREAQEERVAAERRHAEALAAEKRRADEAEALRQREAAAVEADRLAREAEAKRVADEQARRDRDRKHRGAVMKAAKEAIIAVGADEETAKKIVLAIVADEIPAVTLRF